MRLVGHGNYYRENDHPPPQPIPLDSWLQQVTGTERLTCIGMANAFVLETLLHLTIGARAVVLTGT